MIDGCDQDESTTEHDIFGDSTNQFQLPADRPRPLNESYLYEIYQDDECE
jgi:hypothetical protein